MTRNPHTCPHHIIEYDDLINEYYCAECGVEVADPDREAEL